MTETLLPKRIHIATIAMAHGLRGQVRLHCLLQEPDDLKNYTPLTNKEGSIEYIIKITGRTRRHITATVKGIESRDQAEAMKGTKFYITEDLLPKTEEGEFYCDDLIGLLVVDTEGQFIGKISGVFDFGAGDVLEVTYSNGNTELFTFDDDTFPEIDMANERIVLNRPEEL